LNAEMSNIRFGVCAVLIFCFLVTEYEYLRSRPKGRPNIHRILSKRDNYD